MKKLTVYQGMWALLVLHAVRMCFATLQMFWVAIYSNDFLGLDIVAWWAVFIMFICYAICTILVCIIVNPFTAYGYKLLRYKESFSAYIGLQIIISGVMLVGYVHQGGLKTLPITDQISVLTWVLMIIPMAYFQIKAR